MSNIVHVAQNPSVFDANEWHNMPPARRILIIQCFFKMHRIVLRDCLRLGMEKEAVQMQANYANLMDHPRWMFTALDHETLYPHHNRLR